MTTVAAKLGRDTTALEHPEAVGPVGRLGRWMADLIPTLLRVFGHVALACPRWLDRILPDVKFGHV